jgi:hypothetical protein
MDCPVGGGGGGGGSSCTDNNQYCGYWSRNNYCGREYLKKNCRKSCNLCNGGGGGGSVGRYHGNTHSNLQVCDQALHNHKGFLSKRISYSQGFLQVVASLMFSNSIPNFQGIIKVVLKANRYSFSNSIRITKDSFSNSIKITVLTIPSVIPLGLLKIPSVIPLRLLNIPSVIPLRQLY